MNQPNPIGRAAGAGGAVTHLLIKAHRGQVGLGGGDGQAFWGRKALLNMGEQLAGNALAEVLRVDDEAGDLCLVGIEAESENSNYLACALVDQKTVRGPAQLREGLAEGREVREANPFGLKCISRLGNRVDFCPDGIVRENT